jgi:KDO2-lipid IV(A) lauroyltransferase
MEMFYMARLTPAEAGRRVRFEGLEHLWRALERGKGALFLTAHYGAFELMPAAFSLAYGRRVNIVVRRMDWGPAHRMLVALRQRCGNPSIIKGRAMRQIIRLLQAGEVVGLLLDQNVAAREGVFVDFFGRAACTNKGLALLAMHTGAPVVPARIVYEGGGRHRVIVEPEVELTRTGERERDVVENTARFTRVVERWVRERPGHWFWMHRRWKTRPGAEGAKASEGSKDGASTQAA